MAEKCPNIDEPRGCWRVRCQLGRQCVEPDRISNQEREAIVRRAVAERDSLLHGDAQPVYLVATGVIHEGQETYTRHDVRPPLCDAEVLYTLPPTSPTSEESGND